MQKGKSGLGWTFHLQIHWQKTNGKCSPVLHPAGDNPLLQVIQTAYPPGEKGVPQAANHITRLLVYQLLAMPNSLASRTQ